MSGLRKTPRMDSEHVLGCAQAPRAGDLPGGQRQRRHSVRPLTERDVCIGCAACAQTCPAGAIGVRFREELGKYGATVDEAACSHCGSCVQVCPMLNPTRPADAIAAARMHLSHAADPDIRFRSASGGSISQLLLCLLRSKAIDGALLVRQGGDAPLLPEYFVARSEAEVVAAMGSLYAPVRLTSFYESVAAAGAQERLALVGLPCTVYGIRRQLATRGGRQRLGKIAVIIGLFCGRTPNIHATRYMLRRLKVEPSAVRRMNYRSEGWPGSIRASLSDGTVVETPYKSPNGMKTLLSSNVFLPKACYFCNDPFACAADIAAGDAWLPRLASNREGCSIVLGHTDLGRELLDAHRDALCPSELSMTEFLSAHGRLAHSKGPGYEHRAWLYTRRHAALRPLMGGRPARISPMVLLREALYMPVFLAMHRARLSSRYRRLPFFLLRLLKIVARVWR